MFNSYSKRFLIIQKLDVFIIHINDIGKRYYAIDEHKMYLI